MSVSVLARRVAMRSAVRNFTTSAPRKDFGWTKLVTPLTNPNFIARMKELDVKFASMRSEMYGVEAKVEPIDWAFWEANITDKKLVQSLRKEYESATFDEVKGEDVSKMNAALDFAIEKASGAAALSKGELPALQAQLAAAIKEKKEVHNWTSEDYYKSIPGLEQQMRDEFMRGEFIPSEFEERLEAQDINEARKQFKAGQEVTVPDNFPDQIGDFSLKAETKKVDDLLNKMFAGAKQFEQHKLNEKAAEAKKAAAHAAH